MGREPSLHITELQLEEIIRNLPQYTKIARILSDKELKEIPALILTAGRRVSCDNRIVMVSNAKMDRDIKKILKSNKGDTNLMGNLLFSVRKSMKHKAIRRIKEDSREWKQLKELAQVALDFCNDFELSKRKGFILYLEIGLKKINSPRNMLGKLISMYETISLTYEANLIISNDTNQRETKKAHDLYVGKISIATGITETYYDNPLNYIHFIGVREITDKYNVPLEVYIEAQFEGLLWTEGYPSPTQLISDKAIDRLNKYMYKNKIKIKVEEEESNSTSLSNILKRIKSDDNHSD